MRWLGCALVCLSLAGTWTLSGCDEAPTHNASQPEAQLSDAVDELAPLGRDDQGRPYDYIHDPNSPFLKATRKSPFMKALKADANDDIRWYSPQLYAITEPPSNIANVRPMVEWEPMKSIVMSWPKNYVNSAAFETVVGIAKNASTVAEVWFVTDAGGKSVLSNALIQNGISQNMLNAKFRFLETNIDSIWFIDSGPLPLVDKSTNTFAFADFVYYHERPYDDGVPTTLGRTMESWGMGGNADTYRMPVSTEGGTFQSTSDGICFTGTRQLYNMSCAMGGCDASTGGKPSWYQGGNQYANISQVQNHATAKEIRKEWKAYAGCKDTIVTHSITDDGTGHIDMYFKVIDDNTLLLGEYKAPYQASTKQQENAGLLNETAAYLENYVKPDGTKFKVHRLIMPGHRNTDDGWTPFTYINSTFINGLNLWPATNYADWVASRNQAQAKWEEIMPDYEHIWIDSTTLSFWSGAIHCITRTIPNLPAGPWIADGSCSGGTCNAPANGYDGDCTPHDIATPVCWGPEWLCDCNNCGSCPADPDNPAPDGCGDVTYEGCCEGNTLKYCEGNAVKGGNCNNGCGWDAGGGFYNCGGSGADPSGNNPLECGADVCEPECGGKQCGDDGCGGTCGSCEPGESCTAAGQCEGCTPACANKQCGGDGCGGSCGSCAGDQECDAGQCVEPADPCGGISFQGCCDGKELKYCDNGVIKGGNCNSSCGWDAQNNFYECGKNGADPSGLYPIDCPSECVADCLNKACGDDGCGGSCGSCGADEVCSNAGACEVQCEAQCANKQCGDDGCGGSCGTCPGAQSCNAAGQCQDECAPACANKECGDDGCGGSCGTCGQEATCTEDGQCDLICVAECGDKQCGDDGCGGTCGSCPPGQGCTPDGQCTDDCTGSCDGKQCGDDGCGGSCGTCAQGESCGADGQCVGGCKPDCLNKQCGSDGCGGECGACPNGFACDADDQCAEEATTGCGDITEKGQCDGVNVVWCQGGEVQSFDCVAQGKICGFKEDVGFTCIDDDDECTPSCDGLSCGDDGCGGSCGACEGGISCVDGACVDPNVGDPSNPTDPTVGDGGNNPGEDSDGCQSGGSSSQLPMAGLSLGLLMLLSFWRRREEA